MENLVTILGVIVGTMKLGEATLSYDADLPVCETMPWQHITGTKLENFPENQHTK